MLTSGKDLINDENATLLKLLAAGCEKTFKLLYNEYHQRVYHIALRYLKSDVLAQEVVQDVFMKLWLERANIKNGTPVDAWLYTVAKNNTINRMKRIANEWKAVNYLKIHQVQHTNTTQDKVSESDCRNIMKEALDSLSENQLKVYRLAREENFSYGQIASHLNISPLTVKTHMARALAHLKVFFNGF